MNNKQGSRMNAIGRLLSAYMGLGLLLFVTGTATVRAGDLAISAIDVAVLAGDKLQVQLEMNGAAIAPTVVKTDNPARIWLDFSGVKNGLAKKILPINKGAASSIYMVEAEDRLRVVVNLLEATPFETQVIGNKVLLTLAERAPAGQAVPVVTPALEKSPPPVVPVTAKQSVAPPIPAPPVTRRPVAPAVISKYVRPVASKTTRSVVNSLAPEQAISGFDFKRGSNGEGRVLISLANPNTVVNTKAEGGKVVLSFANTRLPDHLAKRLDFSEFATPVRFLEATSSDKETKVSISTQNSLYDYSLFQSDGLLTVEFRPLSNEEKDALDRSRVKYTGERLSLNFQEIDVRSVIAILAEFTGQNVVAGDDVTGTITLKLDDVPWDEALDFVMMTKGLGKFETGNVTLISPLDKIKSYKQKQRDTEKVVAQLDPLITEYIKISYAKATDLKDLLMGRDSGLFGSCGNVQIKNKTSITKLAKATGSGSGSGSGTGTSGTGSQQNTGAGSKSGSNADDSEEEQAIEDASLLSPRGSLFVDSRTNTLIVHETAKQLEEIKKLIRKLDIPVRQVMIEARIVVASNTFVKELGVKFGGSKIASVGGGRVFGVGGPGTVGDMGTSTTKITTTDGVEKVVTDSTPAGITTPANNMLVDLGAAVAAGSGGALAMTLARGADYVLNLELSALQDQGLGELISNPRVMTSDRCLATIKQGVQIPYTSVTNNGNILTSTTIFVDAALQLDVLPQITPSGGVVMSLKISKDAPGTLTNNGQVAIDTRQIETNVQVMDGETVVLGGVFEGTQKNSTNKVPFFADLPGVGFLFKKTFKQDDKSELLIFVTPKIIKDNDVVD